MNRRMAIPLTSLVFFFFMGLADTFSQEASNTKTLSFTKNVVVKKYKLGEVQAEPYTVKTGDSLWKILIDNYGIKVRQFYFFCRITKSLNPNLENEHELVPHQVLLVPFKYVTHFKIQKEDFKSILLKVLSSHYSEIPTEEYTFSEGEHLAQVLRDMYNVPDNLIFNRYLNLVKKLNPELKNLNLVRPDQRIVLPSLSSSPPTVDEESRLEIAQAEEAATPEEVSEEETVQKVAQAEEVPVPEEVLVDKGIEPTYVDPRFRKIAKQIPSSKTLLMDYINSIADVLQGSLYRSDEFTIPLMEEGLITINTSNFPILQLTDKKKVILNYRGELSNGLVELIQSELNDVEVVNLKEDENVESVLDKLISAAGYFSVDKGHNPLVIGDKIQFEITGDWVIYKDELFEDIIVLSLTEEGTRPVDPQLKDYIDTYGVKLIDLHLIGEGEREEVNPLPNVVKHKYRLEDVPVITTSDCRMLVDSLLALLGQNFQNDFKLKLFRGKYEGFDIEINADRYFERGGKGHIISFHTIPEKLREVIVQQGNRFLNLSPMLEDPPTVIKNVLDFLQLSYDAPRPRFSAAADGEEKVELIIPGILIKKDEKTRILLTSLDLEAGIYRWLREKEIKVVRLEVSPAT